MIYNLITMWAIRNARKHRSAHEHSKWKECHIINEQPLIEEKKRDEKRSTQQRERVQKLLNDF